MSTDAESVSRWARRFVLASAAFLVAWQVGTVLGTPRRTAVVLGLYGFVLHVVFGKALSLVPSYFDRRLSLTWAPPLVLVLTATGTVLLAAGGAWGLPVVGTAGAVLWTAGVVGFVAALAWTVRGNVTGRATATSQANEERRPIDRVANAFVPIAFAYLLIGTVGTLGLHVRSLAVPGLSAAGVAHLLAAGFASLMVFAVGFRLLPRFLVVSPPRPLVWLVLPAGATAPAILAWSLWKGVWFQVGAALQALAVVGFAVAFGVMYGRSERRRVGFYGPLAGVLAGTLGVLLGLQFALVGAGPGLVEAHFRLNVLGFLGLTIVGTAYQFYPPTVGTFRGSSDRTAVGTIVAIGGGLLVEVIGLVGGITTLAVGGPLLALAGTLGYAWLLIGLFRERYG